MSNDLISVLAAPLAEPGAGRIDMEVPPGLTIDAIIMRALPGADAEILHLRVTLSTDRGVEVVEPHLYRLVRPRPGVQVIIRVLPGKNALRAILSIVVAVAALAIGQIWGATLALGTGLSVTTAQGLISLGVTLIGNALINALIPPAKPPDADKAKPNYMITGWKNELRPDGVVPDIYGQHRYAPPFAAPPYTEVVGDWLYVRAVFTFGYGPLTFSDHRIGDTPMSEYDEVDIEVREGLATDAPLTLYPRQVYEESVGVELVMPRPRDDLGEVIEDSEPEETPITRRTGADAAGCSIILQFPSGLYDLDTKKGKKEDQEVIFRVRRRLVGATSWTLVATLKIVNDTANMFSRQHTFDFPSRGRWEIEVTRMTKDHVDSKDKVSKSVWVALQTLRPEYPFNFKKPIALVAVRIKATYQLNGGLDSYNALVKRRCLDYDNISKTWIMRETRNPASLYRLALQGPANARPVPDAGIDDLAAFHDFCRLKGLKYDRVHDFEGTLGESNRAICAAGRAAPRHDGLKWGVIIDRPQEFLVEELTPRNAYDWSTARTYIDPPHAFRVPFLDETNDYQSAERIVRWPGYAGEIQLTEELQLAGKTDPVEIYREARRRMYELIYRMDTYQISQEGAVRVLTRGDLCACSFPTLRRTQVAARVKAVKNRVVELDEYVSMETGKTYALRYRTFSGPNDTIGTSVVRTLITTAGERKAVTVAGTDPLPKSDELVQIGEQALEIYRMRVAGIEAGESLSAVFRLVDAAPEIDTLTDALVIPAWSGRVGAEIDAGVLKPAAPKIVSVRTGTAQTDAAGGIDIRVAPGTGSAVIVTSFEISHRLASATVWKTVNITAADGGLKLRAYLNGSAVQMRVRAISLDGVFSDYSATIALVIGQKDAVLPSKLPASITVTPGLGSATVRFATGTSTALAMVQLYRTPAGVDLNRSLHAAGEPLATRSSSTLSLVDGDATTTNMLKGSDFASGNDWSADAGWTVADGAASHVQGSVQGGIRQNVTLVTGKTYRTGLTVPLLTVGTLTPVLEGSSAVSGPVITATGRAFARLQAVTGNVSVGLLASADLIVRVDDFVMFEETADCIDQGRYDYYLEPQNADGVPGPISGPYTVTIV